MAEEIFLGWYGKGRLRIAVSWRPTPPLLLLFLFIHPLWSARVSAAHLLYNPGPIVCGLGSFVRARVGRCHLVGAMWSWLEVWRMPGGGLGGRAIHRGRRSLEELAVAP